MLFNDHISFTALGVMDMQETEVIDIFRLVAGILHVGNIQFAENGNYSQIADKQCKTSIYQEIKKQQ